jgi:hypothetical protein
VKDPDVRLVLDLSAVLAYTVGSVELGQTIIEVVEDGGRFGASVVCLAEATRLADDHDVLRVPLLTKHWRFEMLPVLTEDWDRLAYWTKSLGHVERAASLVEALDRGGYVVTGEPYAYDVNGTADLPIIAI